VRAGNGAAVIVAVGPGIVTVGPTTVTVGPATVTVGPGTGVCVFATDAAGALLLPPIAASRTMNATPPATQPAMSLTGGSAPYRPFGPRVRTPREFSQNAQPGGAGGQDGSGCQPAGGRQPAAGGSGQPGGELKIAVMSSPSGGYIS
jgi:hypothetical protein